MSELKSLNLVWWNAYNFFHFDSAFDKLDRWPKSADEYKSKCVRVDAALKELEEITGKIDILCLCEITKIAAEELRDRLFPSFKVISLDIKVDKPTLQVAIIYREATNSINFEEKAFILAERTPSSTRPMAVLEIRIADKSLRIICCHWTARIKEEDSEDVRYACALYLGSYCYDFVKENQNNSVIIVGDLNEEPFERSLRALHAHRYRGRCLSKTHHTDHPVKRLHLYNLSWRHLGEQYPQKIHSVGNSKNLGCAGTYYRSETRDWHSFDQIILSGGLLSNSPPFIDENETLIISSPAFLTNGLPTKFLYDDANSSGLSDHLPLYMKINI